MQATITNISGTTVPFTYTDANGKNAPYGLPAGATVTSLQMPDSSLPDLVALRASGRITYTLTVLPQIARDTILGAMGRTEVTGTAYTLQDSDRACVIDCGNASATTITLPANLVRMWECKVLQYGAGKVTFQTASGAVLRIAGTATGTGAQYGVCTLLVRDNQGGNSAEWIAYGNVS